MIVKSKLILSIILTLCAVIAVTLGCVFGINNSNPKTDLNTGVEAATYTSGNYKYTYTEGSGVCSISSNSSSKPSGSITIPSSVTISSVTYKVTTIGSFYYCEGITSVTIPNGVTTIESGAFSYCTKMTSISISQSVTSIASAFYGACSALATITVNSNNPNYTAVSNVLFNKSQTELIACAPTKSGSYTVPSTVTTIGASAFSRCSNLTGITIPTSVTAIGGSAFYNCSGLTSISLPNTITEIKSSTFSNCSGLTSFTIPNSVTTINSNAFYSCSKLSSVTIGSGVQTISNNPFQSCSLLSAFTVDTANPYLSSSDGILFNKDLTTLVLYPAGKTVETYTIPSTVITVKDGAFAYCYAITNLIIPDNVLYFGSAYESGIDSVVIGNGLKEIVNGAFNYCRSLSNVTFGNSIEKIGDNSFENCAITSISLPDSLKEIGDMAFNECSLTSVDFGNNIEYMGIYVFYSYCTWYTNLLSNSNGIATSRDGTTKYYISAPSTSITSVDLTGVRVIAGSAFSNCTSLTSVVIPDSVVGIGEYAFERCSAITNVSFSKNLTRIGYAIFSNTTYQTNIKNNSNGMVTANDGVTKYALYYTSSSITSIDLTNVRCIADDTYNYCSKLTSVVIPECMVGIGSNAFYSCTALTEVYFKQKSNFYVGNRAFESNNSNVTYHFVSNSVLNNTKENYLGNFTNDNFVLDVAEVEFESNGGSVCESMQIDINSTYGTLPTPILDNYTFGGWYKTADFSGSPVSASDIVTDSHTLYAKWILITFDVIFVASNGGNVSFEGGEIGQGTEVTSIAYAVGGVSFLYWLKNGQPFDNNTINPLSFTVTEDVTYTAVFGSSFEGVAVASTIGGTAYIVGDNYENLADTDTITFATKQVLQGYVFSHWEDLDGNNLGSEMSIRLQKSLVMDNVITAVYVQSTNSSVNNETSNT